MRIYVGNLSYHTSDEDLDKVFSAYGPVDGVELIADAETGRSHGYGYIDMPDDTTARLAINSLNGSELDNRALIVRPAKDRATHAAGSAR